MIRNINGKDVYFWLEKICDKHFKLFFEPVFNSQVEFNLETEKQNPQVNRVKTQLSFKELVQRKIFLQLLRNYL